MLLVTKTLVNSSEVIILGVFENMDIVEKVLKSKGNKNIMKRNNEYVIMEEDEIIAMFEFIEITLNELTEIY